MLYKGSHPDMMPATHPQMSGKGWARLEFDSCLKCFPSVVQHKVWVTISLSVSSIQI